MTYKKLVIFWVFLTTICCARDGDLDLTFGGVGYVILDLGDNTRAFGVALQSDEKIVGVGEIVPGSGGNWLIVRLTPFGNLDTTFGGGSGFVTLDFGGDDEARGVAIQNDGKIVVAGTGNNDISVARYNTDGSLDTTFNGTGFVTTTFTGGSQGFAVALQTDGKIVVAGRSGSVSIMFTVVRYNTNGSLDTTFNGTGFVITDATGAGNFSSANAVLIQPDGKIVVGGDASVSGNTQFAVARYNTNGSLDTTFGTNGIVRTNIGSSADSIEGVALQSDGKILGAGSSSSPFAFATARYTDVGVLDTTTFNNPTGFVVTPIGSLSLGRAIALQDKGRIIVVGNASTTGDRFAMTRYTVNGVLDSSFGIDGIVVTEIGSLSGNLNAVVIQPADQKIVVAGITSEEGEVNFTIARYIGSDPCKSLIGSDSVLELFTTQQLASSSGRFAKLALLNGGFALCGDATFDSCLPVVGSICLECFTLTLQKDIIMNNIGYFGSVGNIIGNGHVIELAQSVTILPNYVCTSTYIRPPEVCPDVEWGNLVVRLNSDVTLKDFSITFTGISTLDGKGNAITLDNASLIIGSNSSLLLKDISINNIHDANVRCIDDSSLLLLDDVTWFLDNDYTFTVGSFKVIRDFYIMGEQRTFFYQSNQISSIDVYGAMKIGNKVTFKYDPSMSLQNLISLLANSSQIILYGGILRASDIGMILSKGTLVINRCSTLFSEGSTTMQGISLGDGIDSNNNLTIQITPAAQLVIEGPVIYNEA